MYVGSRPLRSATTNLLMDRHPYSLDSAREPKRQSVSFSLLLIVFVLAFVFRKLFTWIADTVARLGQSVGILDDIVVLLGIGWITFHGMYRLAFLLFDGIMWKAPFLRRLFPVNLSGEYTGRLKFKDLSSGTETTDKVSVLIEQSWSRISIRLRNKNKASYSTMARFYLTRQSDCVLHYCFQVCFVENGETDPITSGRSGIQELHLHYNAVSRKWEGSGVCSTDKGIGTLYMPYEYQPER